MTEHIPTPLATRRLVAKPEELRRKREGTRDPTTMVSQTSPEGAALRAHLASLDKVMDAQPIASELRKNETPPKFKAAWSSRQKHREATMEATLVARSPAVDHSLRRADIATHAVTTTVENGTTKAKLLQPAEAATREAVRSQTESLQPGRLAANEIVAAVANEKAKTAAGTSKPAQTFARAHANCP